MAVWGDKCSEESGLLGQGYLPKPTVGVKFGEDLGSTQLCQHFVNLCQRSDFSEDTLIEWLEVNANSNDSTLLGDHDHSRTPRCWLVHFGNNPIRLHPV